MLNRAQRDVCSIRDTIAIICGHAERVAELLLRGARYNIFRVTHGLRRGGGKCAVVLPAGRRSARAVRQNCDAALPHLFCRGGRRSGRAFRSYGYAVCVFTRLVRALPAKPTSPKVKSSNVPGSGTDGPPPPEVVPPAKPLLPARLRRLEQPIEIWFSICEGSAAKIGCTGEEVDVCERKNIPCERSVHTENRGAGDNPKQTVTRREFADINH
jgi:hypothetical protein